MLSADSGDRLSTLSNSYYTASPVKGKRQVLICWWFKIECKGRWLFQKNVGKLSAEWNYNMVIIFSLEKVWEPAMLKSSLVVSVLVFRLSWRCWKCVGSTLDNDYWRELRLENKKTNFDITGNLCKSRMFPPRSKDESQTWKLYLEVYLIIIFRIFVKIY